MTVLADKVLVIKVTVSSAPFMCRRMVLTAIIIVIIIIIIIIMREIQNIHRLIAFPITVSV